MNVFFPWETSPIGGSVGVEFVDLMGAKVGR